MLNLFDTAPVFTWAAKPLASAMPGKVIRISNVGPATVGSFWISDGTRWTAMNGRVVLGRSGAPSSIVGATDGVSEKVLATVAVPAGVMGTSGQLIVTALWSNNNSANNKVLRARLGGLAGTIVQSLTVTTSVSAHLQSMIRNRNAANSQVVNAISTVAIYGSASSAVTTAAVDTSVDQSLVLTGTLTNAGDTATLESYTVELIT